MHARLREKDGGAEGIRTPDPHNAIVVLYQLSYDPIRSGQFRALRPIVKIILTEIEAFSGCAAPFPSFAKRPHNGTGFRDRGFSGSRKIFNPFSHRIDGVGVHHIAGERGHLQIAHPVQAREQN